MKKMLKVRQKCFHFIGVPILSFFAVCLIYIIGNYILQREIGLSSNNIISASAVAFSYSITYWLNVFYPPKPQEKMNKQKKSLKEYVHQYVIQGTPFNRLMVIIYTIFAIIILVIMLASIMN